MKRFYKDVTIDKVPGGFQLRLDTRAIRTQGGAPQVAPARALVEAMAGEWRGQGETIDPRGFPLRDLADYAIDHVAPGREAAIARLLAFAETDTLCYRADPDEPLFHPQQDQWEPLVAACEAARTIRLERISGVIPRPQPAAMLAALREELAAHDNFTLAALATLASLTASLTAALAVLEEEADPAALFAATNLEQDWQAAQWGWDAEAAKVRAAREADFLAAARFARLVKTALPSRSLRSSPARSA